MQTKGKERKTNDKELKIVEHKRKKNKKTMQYLLQTGKPIRTITVRCVLLLTSDTQPYKRGP